MSQSVMAHAVRNKSRATGARTLLRVLLLAILCAGCGKPASAPQALTPKVTVVPVAGQKTANVDEYVGRTEAVDAIEIRSRVSGHLVEVFFKDGDLVKADAPLFEIDPRSYVAAHNQDLAKIKAAETNLGLAKATLARNEPLSKSGVITKQEYEEFVAKRDVALASVEAAKADAARSKLDVDFTKIASPIDGRVDRSFVSKGNLVTGGTAGATVLTRIVSVDPIHVYFEVDERSLLRYLKMKTGDAKTGDAKSSAATPKPLRDRKIACRMQLADEKGFPHEGNLDFAENQVDPGTGTVRLRGVFPNKDGRIAPGFFVRVQVPIGEVYDALLIPEQAIATDLSVKYVYVVGDDNLAVRRDVILGQQRGTQRIVESGLKPGDRVISRGLQRVRPGQKVEPVIEQAPEAKKAVAGDAKTTQH